MHTLHVLHLYHTAVVKVVCQLATACYRQFLYYIAIRWNRLYVQPAFFRFRSIVSSILRFWATRYHLSNNFFRFPFHKILIFNLFPGNSTYFEFWKHDAKLRVFFEWTQKCIDTLRYTNYTHRQSRYYKNSDTRSIHDRYTNYYRQIDDIPWSKRHPGMKQTTVYHHFSINMITKKHYFTENITTLLHYM